MTDKTNKNAKATPAAPAPKKAPVAEVVAAAPAPVEAAPVEAAPVAEVVASAAPVDAEPGIAVHQHITYARKIYRKEPWLIKTVLRHHDDNAELTKTEVRELLRLFVGQKLS